MNPNNQYPTLTKLGPITSDFGSKTEQEGFHPGVDIANTKGTSIPALAGGRVIQAIKGRVKGENNYGNSVIIKDTQGLMHRYSHLDRVNVQPGQEVKPMQEIATMGDSGATYSPSGGDSSNLDYRISNAYGQYIDPRGFLKPIL